MSFHLKLILIVISNRDIIFKRIQFNLVNLRSTSDIAIQSRSQRMRFGSEIYKQLVTLRPIVRHCFHLKANWQPNTGQYGYCEDDNEHEKAFESTHRLPDLNIREISWTSEWHSKRSHIGKSLKGDTVLSIFNTSLQSMSLANEQRNSKLTKIDR